MKRLFSLLFALSLSTSSIKSEINKNVKAFSIIIPLNIALTYMGYKFIQDSKDDEILAQQILEKPQDKINAIRNFCYNYKKTSFDNNGRINVITDNSLSLQFVNLKRDKDGNFDTTQLQEFANLVGDKIHNRSRESNVFGYIIPIVSYILSVGYLHDLNC